MYVCRFAHRGDTFPLGTTSLLEGSSDLQESYNKAYPNSAKKNIAAFWCHELTPCQVSSFSGKFGIYRNLKTKFLNVSGRATTPRCLNFIPISYKGPINSAKDAHVIFQSTLVHWSMCLQFKFELCTLNAQKLNSFIKRPNKPGIIPKFSTKLLFGLSCLCKKIKMWGQHISFRKQR